MARSKKPKLSHQAQSRLNRFQQAVAQRTLKGSRDPDTWREIDEYWTAKRMLEEMISGLEKLKDAALKLHEGPSEQGSAS